MEIEAIPVIGSSIDVREVPRYSASEVAQYLRIPERTLRSWMYSKSQLLPSGVTTTIPPLIEPADEKGNRLSFYNLVEAHILITTRRRDAVPMSAIRAALDYAAPKITAHPLITREFLTEGRFIFERRLGELVNATKQGQLAFSSVLTEYLSRIDRDSLESPSALYPVIPEKPDSKVVTIKPSVSSGVPTISGTGISIPILYGRYRAGDSIAAMAEDYELPIGQIEDAIAYIDAA